MLIRGYGARRFAYNIAKDIMKDHYDKTGKTMSKFTLRNQFVQTYKKSNKWTYEIPSSIFSESCFDYHNAIKLFFNNGFGFPKYRSKKHDKQSFKLNNQQFIVEGSNFYIRKMGWYRMTEELRFEGRLVNATVSQKGSHHYVSITVDTEIKPMRQTGEAIGVDFNVHSIDLSNGSKFEHSQFLKHDQKKLTYAQRVMSRRKKGSANWHKARRRVAKLHERVSNKRVDAHHKLSHQLVKDHTLIALEDLHVRGMMKNRRLSRAIGDASLFQLSNQIEYKSKIHERELVRVGRFFPSSKTCSQCGAVKTKLSLGERVYRCEECNLVLDRDTNAAINILNEGLTVRGFHGSNACGGTVRPELTPSGESDRLVPGKQELLSQKR